MLLYHGELLFHRITTEMSLSRSQPRLWGRGNHNFLLKRLPVLWSLVHVSPLWKMLHTYSVTQTLVQIIQGTADKTGQPSPCRLFTPWWIQDFRVLPWPPSSPDFPLSSASAVVALLINQEWETLRWGRSDERLPDSTGIPLTPALPIPEIKLY